jgi:hypothetical protein
MILAAMLYSPDAGERQVIFENLDKLRHKAVRRLPGTRVTFGVGGYFCGTAACDAACKRASQA